ncbi:hypothetical protein COY17_02440 [Candidatus Saccharibacteria bacterium CG_4_10_14_0_2_um_filter_52_9]|nr:MAG: hypothetical protein COY17_02440 [Candidatus Saccharibacteria bacterium CG_4_10_14_0_2_um_filter_52_9]
MAEEKKSAAKPIADVAHPNTSLPADTSKPVIITNRTMVKDPMMVAVSDGNNTEPSVPTVEKLEPLSAPLLEVLKDEPKAKTEPKSKPEPKPEPSEPEPEPEPVAEVPAEEPELEKPEQVEKTELAPEPEKATESEDATEEKPPADNKTPTQEKAEANVEQDKQRQSIQKLVDSKQYNLPINAVEQRRTKRFIVLGIVLCVVLALAWFEIALDAGLINIDGIKPFTHFFSI